MALQVRALASYLWDPSLNPSTYMAFVTPVLGDMMPSSGLCVHCMHVVYNYACRQNTHSYKIKIFFFKEIVNSRA